MTDTFGIAVPRRGLLLEQPVDLFKKAGTIVRLKRGVVFLPMVDRPRSRNGVDVAASGQNPGQGELRRRDIRVFRQIIEHLDQLAILFPALWFKSGMPSAQDRKRWRAGHRHRTGCGTTIVTSAAERLRVVL